MKKIRLDTVPVNEIDLKDVNVQKPIIAVDRDGAIKGFVVQEQEGWIIRIGGKSGASGFSATIEECIRRGLRFEWIFVFDAKIDIREVSR